jgi:hypothetical protein
LIDSFNASDITAIKRLPHQTLLCDRCNVPNAPDGMPCHIAVDKAFTVKREKIGGFIGEMEQRTMLAVDRAMPVFLGLA